MGREVVIPQIIPFHTPRYSLAGVSIRGVWGRIAGYLVAIVIVAVRRHVEAVVLHIWDQRRRGWDQRIVERACGVKRLLGMLLGMLLVLVLQIAGERRGCIKGGRGEIDVLVAK